MDIRKLRIFCEAARAKSFTKAATNLYMSQPAVSKAIQELEMEIKTPLFERFPKQVVLTPIGVSFLKQANALLSQLDDMVTSIDTIQEKQTLRIGSNITIASTKLTSFLKQLTQRYPFVTLQVEVASVEKTLASLYDHSLDIAFVEGVLPSADLQYVTFASYDIQAVCAYDADFQVASVDDLVNYPLLLREKGSAIRNVLDSYVTLHHHQMEPSWTSTNSNVLLQAAIQGFGITFLPSTMVEKKLKQQLLRSIDLPDMQLNNACHLVWLKGKHLNEVMQHLIDIVKDNEKDGQS